MHLYNALPLVHIALPYNMWSANWNSRDCSLSCAGVLLIPSYKVQADAQAARYNAWLLITLMPEGVVFSFFFSFIPANAPISEGQMSHAQCSFQVMVCPERGALSSVIHNETVEMDNEMVVTILKDVAMGMKFLHFSKTPSQDEELTPNRILLDSNYRAQLMHFQLQAVCTQPPYHVIDIFVVSVGLALPAASSTQSSFPLRACHKCCTSRPYRNALPAASSM